MIPYQLRRLVKAYEHTVLSAYNTGKGTSIVDFMSGRQGKRYKDNSLIKNPDAHALSEKALKRMLELAIEIEDELEAIREHT
jgi:hypothetical protein